MTYPLALLLIFSILFVLYAAVAFMRWRSRQRLLATLKHMPFPDAWRGTLERTPHYPALTAQEREKIERALLRFVHTKRFTGVGMDVSEEMKSVIGFYACVMIRHFSGEPYAALGEIIVYADGFWVDEHYDDDGIVSEQRVVLDGQSSRDTVVLSWPDVAAEVFDPDEYNVVIHEFAHILDFADGFSDGTPPLPRDAATEWDHAIAHELRTLRQELDHGHHAERYHWLGEYAATNAAEFFAVASERFFMQPKRLQKEFPRLFELLESFYGPPVPLAS